MKGDLLEGTLIDRRYRVLRRLGQGGMGMVYLANVEGPAGFEKLVALKVVHSHVAHDVQVIEMFLSEARISAQLSHANIAQIYDLGEAEGVHYLSMEYVRGRDLRAFVKAVDEHEGRIPLPLCVFIVSKLCEALEHAHALRDRSGTLLNLVHRDVTPVNCLLGYSGEVKLIDFGIAKAANIASSTRAGMIRGKLMYMSPEQTWGHTLDRRSDIFALGIILYELLIGARPFDVQDDSEFNLIERIRGGQHPRAAELDPDIPAELDRIVEKALAVEREQRYQSAGEMHEDLQRFLITQQIHVTAKDLGALLIEMVGADAARSDGAAPAELTAQTSLKRTPEGKSELRSRVITQPDHQRGLVDLPTRDHVGPPTAAAMETQADLSPVLVGRSSSLVGGTATERLTPASGPRPRRSKPALPAEEGVTRTSSQVVERQATETLPGTGGRPAVRRPGSQPNTNTVIVSTADIVVPQSTTALSDGTLTATGSGARRRRVGLLALLAGLAVVGAVGWWWSRPEPAVTVLKELIDAGPVALAKVELPAPEPPPVKLVLPQPEPEPIPLPKPPEPKKKVVVASIDKPKPAPPKPTPPPEVAPRPLPVVSAYVTVKANQRSEVFLDGKTIGETPRLRAAVSPGKHQLRVDCLFPSGRQEGKTKDLDLPPWAEAVVQHDCVERP